MDTPLNLVPVGNINKLYKRTDDGALMDIVAYDKRTIVVTAVIASGASQSEPFSLDGLTPALLLVPANFQGDQLALHVSADGVTFFPLPPRDSIYVWADSARRLKPAEWQCFKHLKITAVTTGDWPAPDAVVNQTSAVTLTFLAVP